jgi:hypothetical protein
MAEQETEVGTKAVLKGKQYVAIFFGAAWSGSCKQFLAPLVQVYKKLVEEKGKTFSPTLCIGAVFRFLRL